MLWFTSWLHSSLFLLPICRRSVHFLIQIKQPVDANFFGLFLVSIFPSSWLTQLNKQCSMMKNVGSFVIPNYEIFSFLVAGLLSHNTVLRIINFVKACFQVLSFKNVQSPTRLLFRLIQEQVYYDQLTKDCHMHRLWEWFYTHCTVYFSPIKNKSV